MTVSFVAKGSEERKLQGIAQEIKYSIEELTGNLSEMLVPSENARNHYEKKNRRNYNRKVFAKLATSNSRIY